MSAGYVTGGEPADPRAPAIAPSRRARPRCSLAGADVAYSAAARHPYVWLPTCDIQPHLLASAIVDTAHRFVELCLDGGDITGARWAVDQPWQARPRPASDIAWRNILRMMRCAGR